MKNTKIIVIALLGVFLLTAIPNAQAQGNAPPASSWGIKKGEVYEFTYGYSLDLKMPDSQWEKINTEIKNLTGQSNVNVKAIYNELKSMLIHVQFTIKNITAYNYSMYMPDYEDVVVTEAKFKDSSSDEWLDYVDYCDYLAGKYLLLFKDNLQKNITLADLSEMFSYYLIEGFGPSSWDKFSEGVNFIYSMYPGMNIFIPKSADFAETYAELKDSYALEARTYNYTEQTLDELLASVGITEVKIEAKKIAGKYSFDSADSEYRALVRDTIKEYFNMLGLSISSIQLSGELLKVWDDNGVLKDNDNKFSGSAKIDGEDYSVSIRVRMMRGLSLFLEFPISRPLLIGGISGTVAIVAIVIGVVVVKAKKPKFSNGW